MKKKYLKYVFYSTALLLFLLGTAIIFMVVSKKSVQAIKTNISEVEPQLVIDAGHGGLDGGAVAADGTTESVINLEIALKMREISHLFGLNPVMTRESESLDYPETAESIHSKKVWDQNSRVDLINATNHACLISVHQNTFPDPRPSGTEVLFGKTEGSEQLAQITHAHLVSILCPENRRVAAPVSDKIYLMKNINCPAILVEGGFLSNPAEAAKLESDAYRTELALILILSYLQFIS